MPGGIFASVSLGSVVRSRDFAELIVGYCLILGAVWTPAPLRNVLFCITTAWIIGVFAVAPRGRHLFGFRAKSFRHSLLMVLGGLLCAGLLVLISWELAWLHPPFGSKPFFMSIGGYFVWALLQQFLLQCFFLGRLLRLVSHKGTAVVIAGVLFASAHVPNPVLFVATLVWGIAACALFVQYRNLYSLGIVHWILGLAVAVSAPDALNHHMRVGLGYVRFHPEPQIVEELGPGQLSQSSVAPASR